MIIYIYLLIALILGIIAGVITGIFPGIHINLIAAMLLAIAGFSFLAGLEPIILVTFLVAMAITHTFVDYIPSVFLGAPDEDNFLSILPGHQMLIKGEAYSAIIYTLYGSAIALGLILIISPKNMDKNLNFGKRIIGLNLLVNQYYYREIKTRAAVPATAAHYRLQIHPHLALPNSAIAVDHRYKLRPAAAMCRASP